SLLSNLSHAAPIYHFFPYATLFRSLADQVGVQFFPSDAGQKPEAIVRAAIEDARKSYADVLIVDTAGRLAIDEEMMAEIKAVHADRKSTRLNSRHVKNSYAVVCFKK